MMVFITYQITLTNVYYHWILGPHITLWLDREKSAISHEKLQKWIGKEGKFLMREVEFMKINNYRIILIGKGNKLYSVMRLYFSLRNFLGECYLADECRNDVVENLHDTYRQHFTIGILRKFFLPKGIDNTMWRHENLRREFLSINLLTYHGRVQVEYFSLKKWELSLTSLSTNIKLKLRYFKQR